MPRALLVTFDLIREGEPGVSLSVATLLAAAREAELQGRGVHVEHRAFNMFGAASVTAEGVVASLAEEFALGAYDAIALSAYVWSEPLLRPVMRGLRAAGFRGRLLLGGYQVSYSEDSALQAEYPEADAFVKGYAEEALLQALEAPGGGVYDSTPDFDGLPSPYLSGVLPVAPSQSRVRMETKRGCPYRCSFCAHRDLSTNRVHRYDGGRALAEFDYLAERGVGKVNVLDPVFNMGPEYLPTLRGLVARGYTPAVSFQCRMENVRGRAGDEFLDLCTGLDVTLEFGLQSIHEEELSAVQRKNRQETVERVLSSLNDRRIHYEVSLIYGLPNQTVRSFEATLAFLQEAGCPVIKAFPLMLLRGTELYDERDRYGFVERPMGAFNIPTVVQSYSFDEAEWEAMRDMASALPAAERV